MQYLLDSIRRSKKITQEDMAKLLNIDVRTYQNKEKGVTQFKQNEMFIIAKFFNKKIDEIFFTYKLRESRSLANGVRYMPPNKCRRI
ncbi:helix-turn-helix transcriptional regulator [Veillonella sp.]|uniref:helix-turn-helix transcriptional regulator n=1 Tax=Veillonella sp. TaxID=1926307 RepID=UPI00399FBE4C